jgi:hypothetical protein
MRYVCPPRLITDRGAIEERLDAALSELTVKALLSALMDLHALLAELDNVLWRENQTRYEFADLLAAARTAIDSAADDGTDPLFDLRVAAGLHRDITAGELDDWRDLSERATYPNTERRR